ncbi:MAG: TRAP transporter small permease [Rhodospirillales bacterium]
MKTFETVSAAAAWIAGSLAKLLLLFVVAVMILQVVLRFGFNEALPWPEEASRYAMIWVVMLFAGILIKDEELISVDFFDHFWPKRVIVLRNIVYRALLFGLLVVLLVEGWDQALAAWRRTTAVTQISWFWPYVAIPIGAGLMLLQMVFLVLRDLLRLTGGSKQA